MASGTQVWWKLPYIPPQQSRLRLYLHKHCKLENKPTKRIPQLYTQTSWKHLFLTSSNNRISRMTSLDQWIQMDPLIKSNKTISWKYIATWHNLCGGNGVPQIINTDITVRAIGFCPLTMRIIGCKQMSLQRQTEVSHETVNSACRGYHMPQSIRRGELNCAGNWFFLAFYPKKSMNVSFYHMWSTFK